MPLFQYTRECEDEGGGGVATQGLDLLTEVCPAVVVVVVVLRLLLSRCN